MPLPEADSVTDERHLFDCLLDGIAARFFSSLAVVVSAAMPSLMRMF